MCLYEIQIESQRYVRSPLLKVDLCLQSDNLDKLLKIY